MTDGDIDGFTEDRKRDHMTSTQVSPQDVSYESTDVNEESAGVSVKNGSFSCPKKRVLGVFKKRACGGGERPLEYGRSYCKHDVEEYAPSYAQWAKKMENAPYGVYKYSIALSVVVSIAAVVGMVVGGGFGLWGSIVLWPAVLSIFVVQRVEKKIAPREKRLEKSRLRMDLITSLVYDAEKVRLNRDIFLWIVDSLSGDEMKEDEYGINRSLLGDYEGETLPRRLYASLSEKGLLAAGIMSSLFFHAFGLEDDSDNEEEARRKEAAGAFIVMWVRYVMQERRSDDEMMCTVLRIAAMHSFYGDEVFYAPQRVGDQMAAVEPEDRLRKLYDGAWESHLLFSGSHDDDTFPFEWLVSMGDWDEVSGAGASSVSGAVGAGQ